MKGVLYEDVVHSGEVPELDEEKRAVYTAVQNGNIAGAKAELARSTFSCREGALLLALTSNHTSPKVATFVDKLLEEAVGASGGMWSPYEDFLLRSMGDRVSYTGPPAVGAAIFVFGNAHTVLFAGNDEVVSLNGGERFAVRTLTAEIATMLKADAESVQEMFKMWFSEGLGYQLVEKSFPTYKAGFEDYMYDEPASSVENTKYIELFGMTTPNVACTVSTKLLEMLT